jgi:hypothetical protein
LAGETEVLGEYLPQCHIFHHKSHMTRAGTEAAALGSRLLVVVVVVVLVVVVMVVVVVVVVVALFFPIK